MKEQQPVDPQTEKATEEQGYEAVRKDAKKDYIIACLAGSIAVVTALIADYNVVHDNMPSAIMDGAVTLIATGAGLYSRRMANDGFQRALMLEQANEYQEIVDAAMNQFGRNVLETGSRAADAINRLTVAVQSGETETSQPNDADPMMPAANHAE